MLTNIYLIINIIVFNKLIYIYLLSYPNNIPVLGYYKLYSNLGILLKRNL